MDVTEEYLEHVNTYGGSDSTRKDNIVAQKTLNYGSAGSIDKPDEITITSPTTLNYKDELGLFGLENHYIKVNLKADPASDYNITIENNDGGNKYENIWLDIGLLDSSRKTASEITLKGNGYFYVGVHSRNTRRLPYDFDVKIETA